MIALAMYLNGLRKMTQVGGFITKAKRMVSWYENFWKDVVAEANVRALRNNLNPLYEPEEGVTLYRVSISDDDIRKVQEEAFGEAKLPASVFEHHLGKFGEYFLTGNEILELKYYIRITVHNAVQRTSGKPITPHGVNAVTIVRAGQERMKDLAIVKMMPETAFGLAELSTSKS
jgi:hypothetical protein